MNKSTRIGLLALAGVLVVCGLPFFSRLSSGTHEAAGRQPLPSASPSLRTATAIPTASPTLEQTDTDTVRAGRERLQTRNRELKQANTAIDTARQKAEADKKRAEKNTAMMAALNAKLLDPNLKVPPTVSEAGSLMGQNLADTARFKKKWGDNPPAAGTPEADEYAREQDALMSQSATLLKFMSDEKNAALLKQPDGVAQFQTVSLTGALGLRDDQAQAINTALDGYYQQFFTQGLNSEAQPETGLNAWNQQRLALSQQAYASVTALLTPDQAAAFHDLYPTAGIWMFHVTFGGLPVSARPFEDRRSPREQTGPFAIRHPDELMSKSTRFGFVMFVAALLVCAALVFIRGPSGTGTAAGSQPSPTASVVALPPAAPRSEPTESVADLTKRESARAKGQQLRQTNAVLDQARRKAEAAKQRAEENTQAMAMLTGKLLDPGLQVPHTASEAGSLAGQNRVDAAKFRQKWGDSVPAAGTPEADEYARGKEVLVSESAAYLKFMADEKNAALLAQPDGVAQFQAASLASALALRADQVQGIDATLNGYYQQFYAQGLNAAAQPQTGADAWQQQRIALSQQSYAAVSAFLTPEQSAAFQRLFPPAGSWMFTAATPEVLGLDETH